MKKWTKEMCLQEAQKCKTKREFREKYPAAYYAACKNKWLGEYQFLISDVKSFVKRPSKPWTKERCMELAKKCHSIREFSEKFHSAYNIACHKKWLEDFTWLKNGSSDNKRTVYAYVFDNQKAAYIGLTNNVSRRNKEHRIASEKYDVVIRFCKHRRVELPEVTVLEDDISLTKSLEKEKFYINKYKNNGYQIINSEKIISRKKWTYDTCYTEAKKYKTIKDFFRESRSTYNCAKKNNWLKEYTWLSISRRDNYWNKETCKQEAEKYSSRNEFRINAGAAYRYALINGWINDYTWFKRPTVWNKGKTIK